MSDGERWRGQLCLVEVNITKISCRIQLSCRTVVLHSIKEAAWLSVTYLGFCQSLVNFFQKSHFQWLWYTIVSFMVRDVAHSISSYAWKIS